MTYSCERDPALQDFSGFAPLFPLPNVVLFPHALLPLQIFEHRYRLMTADVLDGERMIAMSLLRPGWDKLPSSANPPIHRIVGLGKIIAHEKLDDGRYYLVLRGLARAKLVDEKSVDLPYRIGKLEICDEVFNETAADERIECAEELVSRFVQIFPGVNIKQLFLQAVSDLPLEVVCDVLLGSIPMAPEVAQQFLDEPNVDTRSQMLIELLKQFSHRMTNPLKRSFPPDFSPN
jgi:Lon protease-like protein